jgi:hypothetical protein
MTGRYFKEGKPYYYSDFGRIPLSRIPQQFHAAKYDMDVRLALAAYVWAAWKKQDKATLHKLGLKYV